MTQHTHIIGIGGAGMGPIAQVLHERGDAVSGCDRAMSEAITPLIRLGIPVEIGHNAAHLDGIDRLLVTSALPTDHPELVAARERGIPILTRHDIWREWSAERPTIAITGTHGKTTTTAMTALIVTQAGRNPGYIVGARVPALGGNARWGSDLFILEADEYARTFLALTPQTAVITNIDWDHVDIYPSQADYDAAFRQFAATPGIKHLIVCGDDDGARRVCGDLPAIWCGLDAGNAWQAVNIHNHSQGCSFDVLHHGAAIGSVQLPMSGDHVIRDALLAVAAADCHAIPFADAAAALAQYHGSSRRFEFKGERAGVTVIDDYAHHPTEIVATLAAARVRFGQRRIIAYFQPHTFSRLEAFQDAFAAAFKDADLAWIGSVYGAREANSSDPIPSLVAQMPHPNARAIGNLEQALESIRSEVRAGDVVLTLGAGDGVVVGERLLDLLGAL